MIRHSAGIPGSYCGTQTEMIENDRLVPTKNVLQKTFISFKQKQGFGAKYDKTSGGDATKVPHEASKDASKEGSADLSPPPSNEV